MKTRSTLLAILFLPAIINAQYCSPSFFNGCFLWNTQSVQVGTLDWAIGGEDCSQFDHTATSTAIVAGEATAMTVVSGVWCGCAVWVDLDNNGAFEDSENLYTLYTGGDPSCTYDFDLTIPEGTLPGAHRMRIISPWGSDGTTVGENGYGPCGNYQYGNFTDFTLDVSLPTTVAENPGSEGGLHVGPNPTAGPITFRLPASVSTVRVVMQSTDGRLLREWTGKDRLQADLSDLPAGVYLLRTPGDGNGSPVRLVKQ
jgi:hypothetical protein